MMGNPTLCHRLSLSVGHQASAVDAKYHLPLTHAAYQSKIGMRTHVKVHKRIQPNPAVITFRWSGSKPKRSGCRAADASKSNFTQNTYTQKQTHHIPKTNLEILPQGVHHVFQRADSSFELLLALRCFYLTGGIDGVRTMNSGE